MEKIIGETHAVFRVSDSSHTGHLRRAAKELALTNGFTSAAVGRAEIIATELATNLIKHVEDGGEVLLGSSTIDDRKGLEMLSLDKGRGMPDCNQMLVDGVSTAGTLGGGLGAIKRLSDEFDIHSQVGRGTAIFSRIWSTTAPRTNKQCRIEIGGVVVPKPGEEVSGDRWAARFHHGAISIMVVDGLGHGRKAAIAAEQSISVFEEAKSVRCGELLHRMHDALAHTQGAAIAIADLDPARALITYAGIGNISGRVYGSDHSRGCVSMPGGVGFQLYKVQEFTYPWEEQSTLLMNSDGLVSAIDASGLRKHHATLIAGILYRDYRRNTDDATVVVAKVKEEAL